MPKAHKPAKRQFHFQRTVKKPYIAFLGKHGISEAESGSDLLRLRAIYYDRPRQ